MALLIEHRYAISSLDVEIYLYHIKYYKNLKLNFSSNYIKQTFLYYDVTICNTKLTKFSITQIPLG